MQPCSLRPVQESGHAPDVGVRGLHAAEAMAELGQGDGLNVSGTKAGRESSLAVMHLH